MSLKLHNNTIGLSVHQFLHQRTHFSLQLPVGVYHRNPCDRSIVILSSKSHNKTSAFDSRKKQAKRHCLESKLNKQKHLNISEKGRN